MQNKWRWQRSEEREELSIFFLLWGILSWRWGFELELKERDRLGAELAPHTHALQSIKPAFEPKPCTFLHLTPVLTLRITDSKRLIQRYCVPHKKTLCNHTCEHTHQNSQFGPKSEARIWASRSRILSCGSVCFLWSSAHRSALKLQPTALGERGVCVCVCVVWGGWLCRITANQIKQAYWSRPGTGKKKINVPSNLFTGSWPHGVQINSVCLCVFVCMCGREGKDLFTYLYLYTTNSSKASLFLRVAPKRFQILLIKVYWT